MTYRQKSGWSRQQGGGRPSGSVCPQGILDESQDSPSLLFEGYHRCHDSFRESESPLRLRPQRQTATNDRRPNGLLGPIVRRLEDVRVFHKRPKGGPELGKIPAKLLGFGVSRFFSQSDKPAKTGSNAAEFLPQLIQGDLLFQIPMPQGKDLLDLIQSPLSDVLGSRFPINQFSEIPRQVCPAQLPLFGRKPGIGGKTVRHDQPLEVPKKSVKGCLTPVGIDKEYGQRIRNRNPKPLKLVLQKPTGFIDVDCLSVSDGFFGLLIRSFQGRGKFSFGLTDTAPREGCLRTKQVDQQLLYQRFAEVISAGKEAHQRFEAEAHDRVASGIGHLGGEMLPASTRAQAGVKAELCDNNPDNFWKIHLLNGLEGKAGQIPGGKWLPACGASVREDILNMVHPFGGKQGPARARMAFLRTMLSTRGLPLPRTFPRRIMGRGRVAVAGVRSNLSFQLKNFLLSLFKGYLQNGEVSHQLLHGRSKVHDLGNSFLRKVLGVRGPRGGNLELGEVHILMIEGSKEKYKGEEGERLRILLEGA